MRVAVVILTVGKCISTKHQVYESVPFGCPVSVQSPRQSIETRSQLYCSILCSRCRRCDALHLILKTAGLFECFLWNAKATPFLVERTSDCMLYRQVIILQDYLYAMFT
jgi:hypothetical protein